MTERDAMECLVNEIEDTRRAMDALVGRMAEIRRALPVEVRIVVDQAREYAIGSSRVLLAAAHDLETVTNRSAR